jgi:hypothetical protein
MRPPFRVLVTLIGLTVVGAAQADDPPYVGLKLGSMLHDEDGYKAALNLGVTAGMELADFKKYGDVAWKRMSR